MNLRGAPHQPAREREREIILQQHSWLQSWRGTLLTASSCKIYRPLKQINCGRPAFKIWIYAPLINLAGVTPNTKHLTTKLQGVEKLTETKQIVSNYHTHTYIINNSTWAARGWWLVAGGCWGCLWLSFCKWWTNVWVYSWHWCQVNILLNRNI